MEPTLSNTGDSDRRWLVVYGALTVLAAVVYVTTDFGPWATLAGTGGLLFALLGLRSVWQLLAARSVGRESIGSLGGYDGAVEIEGAARPVDEPMVAPLTGSDCVAYQVEVFRWSPDREDSD